MSVAISNLRIQRQETSQAISNQEPPGKSRKLMKRQISFQRLSQNTVSSTARMKTMKSVGVEQNGKAGSGPAGLLMKSRPKTEMTSVIQHDLPYDSLSNFENQTEVKAQDVDGPKFESYRSICMACTRQVACKPSLDTRERFEEYTQLLPSTPSSPIPTQYVSITRTAQNDEQEWQAHFTALTTMLIRHADQLQRLSLDLLKSDTKVKEVLLAGYDLADNYAVQERKYETELLYYNSALKRQQVLLDTLESLIKDVRNTQVAHVAQIPAVEQSINVSKVQIVQPDNYHELTRAPGNFATRIRWKISQLIGGCVGTGHVVESSCSDDETLVLSGTGVLLEQTQPVFHDFVLFLDLTTLQEKYQIKTLPLSNAQSNSDGTIGVITVGGKFIFK
ncbi:unnamed protein product [Umbelopsis sp. WA50703]